MTVSYYEASSSSSASPANCLYGIELTQDTSLYDVEGRAQAWRMRITVTDWYNLDPNIFVYLRSGPDLQGNLTDTFEAVASPTDLEEYPPGAPIDGKEPPFYRMAQVDLISRNQVLLEETWTAIKEDRDELIRTLAGICELETNEVSRYGDFPDDVEEDTTTPTVPEPVGSSEPDTCPDDLYEGLEVIESDDADFPVGTLFIETGVQAALPTCARTWQAVGVVSGKTMELETSLSLHIFTCNYAGTEVDSGGLGDDYNAYIFYDKPGGDDGQYTLRIHGVEASS